MRQHLIHSTATFFDYVIDVVRNFGADSASLTGLRRRGTRGYHVNDRAKSG
jgi:hypothetical protein